jgi:hypothetical protein
MVWLQPLANQSSCITFCESGQRDYFNSLELIVVAFAIGHRHLSSYNF